MEKYQAIAVSQMGEGVSEYNRGVLAALGHNELFVEWDCARLALDLVTEKVIAAEAAVTPAGQVDSLLIFPVIDSSLIAEQDAARARKTAAWAPIEALRRQALDALEAADPFGMGQAS